MTSGSVNKHEDKKEKKKITKKKRKSKKFSCIEDVNINCGGSGDEIMDLEEELHPIGFYINDRDEMINQMFSVIKPDKLRGMLPPILKECSIEQLKAYCLDELLGMSWKRINSVLEGKELDTSSESEDEFIFPVNENNIESSPSENEAYWSTDEENLEKPQSYDEKACTTITEDRSVPANDMDTLEIGITNEEIGELLGCVPANESIERKRPVEDSQPSTACQKKRRWKPIKAQVMDGGKKDKPCDKSKSATEDNKGKTLLEILELEMRARAIRALLKQQGEEPSAECENVKEKPIVNIVSVSEKSQDCGFSLSGCSKPRKKLNRSMIKSTDTCHRPSVNVAIDLTNTSEISGNKEDEASHDEQTIPNPKSETGVKEEIICTEIINKDENLLNFREDGEISTDGDSILEIQPACGSSDIIVVEDSEEEMLDIKEKTCIKLEDNKKVDFIQELSADAQNEEISCTIHNGCVTTTKKGMSSLKDNIESKPSANDGTLSISDSMSTIVTKKLEVGVSAEYDLPENKRQKV
ncbi:hypothetical protein L9F63_018253 [Diploptera punctata]|uniref:Caspase activity and apoptosis inhibitor 1 n=1 Tax=Diploptera punctata TaxID=6984 RepID=A0AAD7ZZ02_DIPPU|nr:hypothetical protein L9F63_018253 [Diploptera punctata]